MKKTMRHIIGVVLSVAIVLSITTMSFAANTNEEYYTIQVEYADNIGHREQLELMVSNNNVFVDAEMLAERLGYTFGENSEMAMIYNHDTSNGLPVGITQFKYNSTQVSHMLLNKMVDTYEAPFASIKNSEGSWIPFQYSLLLINSGMVVTDNSIRIDMPDKRVIDYFFEIIKNSAKYSFDWTDDFGYTETDIKVLGGGSHLVNLFNGLLGFDGASWATLFQQFAGNTEAYDDKYGEDLALLLCTESEKELQAATKKVKLMSDLLNVDGNLGKLLSFTSDMTDFQVGTLYEQCAAVLEGLKNGNSSAVDYSKSYQALEDALNRQTWFSNTGGNILEIQKGMSNATGKTFSFLEIGVKVAEVVGYAREFQNQDEFSLNSLIRYLDTQKGGIELPEAMQSSMLDYTESLSGSIGGYVSKRFFENVDRWLLDAAKEKAPLHKVLGSQAAAALIAWDIASNTIPFVSNGLSSADNFELTLYSLMFQCDASLNFFNEVNSVFSNTENITSENLYELSKICYVYLKSCYTTREAALKTLVNKSSSTKEKIQPLIDYQNSINTEIAEILVELKGVNKTNDNYVFGFLPTNNEGCLSKYDDNKLAAWVGEFDLVTDAYSEEFGGRKFYIPNINLSSEEVANINAEIWATLYDGVVNNVLDRWNQDHYEGSENITYNWYLNGEVLSVVIESNPFEWAWTDYYVYNINITTGTVLSSEALIQDYGISTEEYNRLAEQVLGSKFWNGWDRTNENFQSNTFVLRFNEALQRTISQAKINQTFPYINDKGELCMIAKVYSLAGAEYYWNNLNMVNFALIPDYATPAESNIHAVNISEDQAYQIACDYWNYKPGDISSETGFELFVVPEYDGGLRKISSTGKSYYSYMLRWLVVDSENNSNSWMSTCDIIFIDAETGECVLPIYE